MNLSKKNELKAKSKIIGLSKKKRLKLKNKLNNMRNNSCNFDNPCKHLMVYYKMNTLDYKCRLYQKELKSEYKTIIKRSLYLKCDECMIWRVVL